MLKKAFFTFAIVATVALGSISVANASPSGSFGQSLINQTKSPIIHVHNYYSKIDILRDRGFRRIRSRGSSGDTHYFKACRKGLRYHIAVNYYGEITSCVEVGHCGFRRHLRRYRNWW